MRFVKPALVWTLCLVMAPGQLVACPFCSAVSQTLRQEMEAMDAVAVARVVPDSQTDSDAEFIVGSIIQGSGLVSPAQSIRMNYFGKPKPDQQFLIMGVDPPELLWSSPMPVSDVAIDYVKAVHEMSRTQEDTVKRLEFYIDYLEHPESLLARDAYDEFAGAPYADIKALKPKLDREQLIEWIKDTDLPPDRKRLYLVMLGVVGEASDANFLQEMLRSDDPNRRAGLDAMIACYATLKGEAGLELIDELFLKNEKSQYADTYAAIMALRFHGTDGGVIPQERVLKSMRLILDRPELADLVIPDLARWEDWSQIAKLSKLFRQADEKSSWVRVPVINYLRACPLPEAEQELEELKAIDPAAYKRATSFFPVPKSSAGTTDSSSNRSPVELKGQFGGLASDATGGTGQSLQQPVASTTSLPAALAAARLKSSAIAGRDTNRSSALSVLAMASVTLGLSMWLAISGAGNSPLLALLRSSR